MKPKVTCGAIMEKEGKILLTKRNIDPYKGYWCWPGGHVDFGEKAVKAIKREVMEEVSLNFEPEFIEYFDEIIPEIQWHAVVLMFKGNFLGEIKPDPKEVSDFGWFSKEETSRLKLAFKMKDYLNHYFIDVRKN